MSVTARSWHVSGRAPALGNSRCCGRRVSGLALHTASVMSQDVGAGHVYIPICGCARESCSGRQCGPLTPHIFALSSASRTIWDLLQDVRAASVRALTQATLLALHRDDFKRMLGNLQVIMRCVSAMQVSGFISRKGCSALLATAIADVFAWLLAATLWMYTRSRLGSHGNFMILQVLHRR